ncbi:MAG: pyridoxal phosphate-dependent aminotransferase [Pseudomonadota bacterium]
MDNYLSRRVQAIKPSPTLAVTARAARLKAAGRDIVSLGAGEPDFDTPDYIKEAAIQAIRDGFTKYTAVDGTPGLKQAIIDKFARDNGFHFVPEQILVSVGGKQSIFNLCQALLNPGDEVIVPAPYWVSYTDIAILAEARPVILETGMDSGFKITPEQLAAAITPQTRLLFINSPSNPTGAAYTAAELAALGEVLRRHPRVLIATDDMYEKILFTEAPFVNIANACPDLLPRTVVLNGVSKAYAMTGWRIGYCAGPRELIQAMTNVQSQSTSSPCSIAQKAAEAALSGDQSVLAPMLQAFRERHDYVVARLQDMPGVACRPSQGTFYAFPSFHEAMARLQLADDITLAERLLEEAEVALVPGSAFGADGYLRISYATSMDNLRKALDRIEAFLTR